MAFGARELRLILSIQSYGTGNIARLRRDILSLQRTTQTANAMQTAVANDILRKQTQLVRTQDRIARVERATIARRIALEGRAARTTERFSRQRERAYAREAALANTIAAKKLQIARSEDRAKALFGSGMERFSVREQQLATQRLRIQRELANLPAKEATMQSRILSNRATILHRERQLQQIMGKNVDLQRMATGSLAGFGTRVREISLRYRAALQTQKSLNIQQKNMSKNAAILSSQLQGITAQEKLIRAQKYEQAAAAARQLELTSLQQAQLAAIEARQAQIAVEVAAIDKAEAQVNAELREQLALLQAENVQLDRARIAAGELAAEIAMGNGAMMARARAMDNLIDRQNRLMQMENRSRMFAHGFRTAQFTGLVGTAVSAGASHSFATFNKQLTLAATQARSANQTFADIPGIMDQISNGTRLAGEQVKGIRQLMQEFPSTAEEMAQAAYDIYSSMDVNIGSGLKLLRSFNQLAVATGSELAIAVDAGITVLNNFGVSTGGVNEQLNLMMTIIRFGRMHLEDLNAMLEKVAPAATASGQSLADVAGALIAITRLQPSQRVGATGIARLLQTFRDPDFQRGAFKFGADITKGAEATGRLKPLPEILKAMSDTFGTFEAFGGPGALFQKLTAEGRGRGIGRQSRIEATNAFVFLVGHMKQYLELQDKATKDTGEFANALKSMSESPGVRWEIFINQLRAFVLVVGEAVLPAMLQVAEKVAVAVKWFQRLSDGQKSAAGKALVFGSIALLLVGTLGNLVFSLRAAAINMMILRIASQLMGEQVQKTAVKAGLLVRSINILAGIGIISIPIVMQLIKGGEPGLWDFLSAAGFGAMGGFMIGGAPGAVLGAITVPVIIKYISEKEQFAQAQKDFGAIAKRLGMDFGAEIDIEEMGRLNEWLQKHPKKAAQVEAAILKQRSRNAAKEAGILENYNDTVLKQFQEQLNAAGKNAQALENATRKSNERQVALQKAHTNAIQRAMEEQEQTIKTATDNILGIYEQFYEQNEQALGEFGRGPVMSGFLGDIFGGVNDLLRQFGVQIPVPFEILRRDFELQLTYFQRFQTALDNLIKRGAPLPLVQQIQAMGPDAGIAIAEGLLSGSKGGFNQLMTQWKKSQRLLDNVTKKQLDRQLAYWLQYGKDAAWQTIMGIINNPRNAQIRTMYESYVKKTFGGVLAKQFKETVAAEMAQAIADLNAAAAAATAAAVPTNIPGMPAAGPTALQKAVNTRKRTLALLRQNKKALATMGTLAVSPLGPGGQTITRQEQIVLEGLQDRRMMLINRAQQQARIVNRERRLANIRGQRSAFLREHPGAKKVEIVYNNETYHFSSTMTAEQIMRAIQRRRRQKRKKQAKT